MNEKMKAWLMRVSPEKVVLAGTGIAIITSLTLMVSGVLAHNPSLRRAGGIALIVAIAIAFIPLAGLLIMLAIEKLKRTRQNRTTPPTVR